jgi:addiction module RelB/DinJ family antitoxin
MTTLQIRINKSTKEKAKRALEEMGLDISSGIKLFLEQVITTKSIPFIPTTKAGYKLRYIKLYKKELAEALKSKGYKTAEELHENILNS